MAEMARDGETIDDMAKGGMAAAKKANDPEGGSEGGETAPDQSVQAENIKAIADYFRSGIKGKTELIGIELEHTLVRSNGEPVSYDDEDGQQWLVGQLQRAGDEEIRSSAGYLIGLSRKGETITLEPAAQVELSSGPYLDLEDALVRLNDFEQELAQAYDRDPLNPRSVDILTPGYHPTRRADELEIIPKERYRIMNEYLGSISMYGICMMRGSASTQVSIDYSSEADCLRKMRLASACVPILSLMCDNSPVFEGRERTHNMVRTEIWEKCDPERCGIVPGVMRDDFTFEDYAAYILATPAMVDASSGKDEYSTRTFNEIFADTPMSRADVEHALSVFFTDVRLKTYVEIRPADAMPPVYAVAYAALIKGLFYGTGSLDALDALFDGVTAEDIKSAKASLMADGYDGQCYGHPVSEMADELVSIAKTALGDSDLALLEPLTSLVALRTTLADMALRELGR